MRARANGTGIGQPVRRKEDFRLLTGRGRYGDDVVLPGMAHAVFVRSPHAHARIVSVDKAAALAAPGVLAVLTGADYVADGLGPIPHNPGLMRAAGRAGASAAASRRSRRSHFPLPADKARYVGEPVALVVAETIAAAKDAAELLDIAYEPLPAVTRAADAREARRAAAVGDGAGQSLHRYRGRRRGCDRRRLRPRRACRAARNPGAARHRRADGAAHQCRRLRSRDRPLHALHRQRPRRRQGQARPRPGARRAGRAGARACATTWAAISARAISSIPNTRCCAWAARRVGRPVKWTCERTESFLSDYQGRDLTVEAELALDEHGNFLAVRGSNLSNLGGHAVAFGSLQKGLGLMSSVYHIPVGYFRGRGAVTNTVPTTPYRSAGRPEVIFVIERLVDLAADQLGLDPAALRRRNLIPPAAQPYANPLGLTYDSGHYEEAMDTALALADWDGFPARRAEARQRGKRRGIGIANYVEITSRRAARAHRDHRAARRQGRAGDGHDVLGPGARDELRAARHRMARRAVRQHRLRRPRHRAGRRPAAARIPAAR